MTNVESMDYTHSHLPSLLASSVPCIALSHLESWCKLRDASKPRDVIRSITHKPPYIFLKTATIPTYLWHFHSHSEIYCHATFHRSVYYDMLHHCHIALHDRKIASMMFSWLVHFLMSLRC